jgi:hypothetical protein
MLSDLWYRGVNQGYANQAPGVYRPEFTSRAAKFPGKDIDEKRLSLERALLSQFRTAGAAFITGYTRTQIYFLAQHFGMPTRLLDWSTNPLAALFFACEGPGRVDGFVYAMDAKKVVAPDAERKKGKKLYQAVMTMRDPFVEYAIDTSFWPQIGNENHAHILPVRPDSLPGRMGQQSSCFTLHMHNAKPVNNKTTISIRVDGSSKGNILRELHRVNINQFTTYYDLDHLSKEIKRGWGI